MVDMTEVIEQCRITALWSDGESLKADGESLDTEYSLEDLSPQADERIAEMCQQFVGRAGDLLDDYPMDSGQLGHDIWLTVNGHGTGFWDCDELDKNMRDSLTLIAQSMDEQNLYVGDDGLIYCG